MNFKAIGNELVEYIANRLGKEVEYQLPGFRFEVYCRVWLPDDYSLWFMGWESGLYYFIVEQGPNRKMELNLERLKFASNKYTWLLSGQHKTYKDFLSTKYGIVQGGYPLCQNASKAGLKDAFFDLIASIIGEETFAPDSEEAYEGYAVDRKILSRTRNKPLADKRKQCDNYTCQACSRRIVINGKPVIECHHKNPLRGEVKTTIEDLVSLCPTCHRIAHLRKHPYSVDEIRKLLEQIKHS